MEKWNQIKKLNFITDNISIIGPYLILLGVIRLYSYYSVFKINILNYLDFSEYIISFFNCGFILICFILLCVGFGMTLKLLPLFSGKKNPSKLFGEYLFRAFYWALFQLYMHTNLSKKFHQHITGAASFFPH
jgi:hypothetical protein